MFKLKRIIILISILFIYNNLSSQSKEEILSLKKIPRTETTYNYSFTANNEYQLVLNNLFVFYKKIFSANDFQSCSFYPSCSQYAMQTIHKHGFIIGLLDTFDRLSRCNGMSPENYPKYLKSNLLFDKVL